MLRNFVSIGDKIELQAVESDDLPKEKRKIYTSSVQNILSDEQMEIAMPMEKTKLILLPVDNEYDMVLYTRRGLYQCFVRIVDRYKSDNVYLLVAELTSNLRKFQRREYYRFSCALEMCARSLKEDEAEAVRSNRPYQLTPGLPLKQSVIVDISGGGLRFLSRQRFEPGSLLYISYNLLKGEEEKKYEVLGKVLSANQLENKPDTYEHRVQYYHLDVETREEIIQYIFAEQRKSRKKERLI